MPDATYSTLKSNCPPAIRSCNNSVYGPALIYRRASRHGKRCNAHAAYLLLTKSENPEQAFAAGARMSWTMLMLIGWPLASLAGGPVIGRFVAVRMDEPKSQPEANRPARPATETQAALSTIGVRP